MSAEAADSAPAEATRTIREHRAAPGRRLRVMHVASGGFSGATQVAIDLVQGAGDRQDTLLVLRSKRHTPMARIAELRSRGTPVEVVPGWSHMASVWAIRRLCRHWKPDAVVAHGFPEHLLARWGALWAGVPTLVQVEHNVRERYTAFKRWQVVRLSPHTAAFVGVSHAVADVLRNMDLPASRIHALLNGVDLEPYAHAGRHPWVQRDRAVLMAARFGAQKDHETLIRALPLLEQRHGLRPQLRLAGGGSHGHQQSARELAASLGLQSQVEFLGHRSDVPELMMNHRVVALSTRYEGLPLVMVQALAAGCAVVATDEPALREVLAGGQWGRLVAPRDPLAWADALAQALAGPGPDQATADRVRLHVEQTFSRAAMVARYAQLIEGLASPGAGALVGEGP